MTSGAGSDPRLGVHGDFAEQVSAAARSASGNAATQRRLEGATLVELELRPVPPSEAAGDSRWGGSPDAQADFSWPMGPSGPLWFVMQLDLRALPALPHGLLPKEGLLQLYAGRGKTEDVVVAQLVLQQGAGARAEMPPANGNDESFAGPVEVEQPLAGVAQPRVPSSSYGWSGSHLLAGVSADELEQYSESLGQDMNNTAPQPGRVRLLGHAEDWREEPQVWAAGEDALGRNVPEDWLPLLVFSSPPGWWGDESTYGHVMVHRDDLAARALDRAVVCYCQ